MKKNIGSLSMVVLICHIKQIHSIDKRADMLLHIDSMAARRNRINQSEQYNNTLVGIDPSSESSNISLVGESVVTDSYQWKSDVGCIDKV